MVQSVRGCLLWITKRCAVRMRLVRGPDRLGGDELSIRPEGDCVKFGMRLLFQGIFKKKEVSNMGIGRVGAV